MTVKLSTLYFSVGIAVAALNLIATTLLIFQFRVYHAGAEAERAQQTISIKAIQTNLLEVDTLRSEYVDANKKLQQMIDLAIDTQQRQAINEANIQTTHDYLSKVAKAVPTTKPIVVPEQVALPDRKEP